MAKGKNTTPTTRMQDLDNALREASDNGTLDELCYELHPDAINAFCDAVTEANARKTMVEKAAPDIATRPIPNSLEISAYAHCGKCVKEFMGGSSEAIGESPQTFARLSIGYTNLGLQVWCYRHNCNVVHIDFGGQQLRANTTAAGPEEENAHV